MQNEIRLASFNVRNLARPGLLYYKNRQPYSPEEYEMKTAWIAGQLDQSQADIIGLQEIFSPESIPDVLAKTRHYKKAYYVTVESADTLPESPNVALISRLPIAGTPVFHTLLPDHLEVSLPGDNHPVNYFSRPVLHATIRFPDETPVHILVAHLKSAKPDYPENANPTTPLMPELGALRSLMRRGTDALGIRHLVVRLRHPDKTPLIVMGDLNDFSQATSTQIIAGDPHHADPLLPDLLYNCFEIQPGISYEEKNSLFMRGTELPRIDHILVSEEFTAKTRFRLGRISNVRYFNTHLDRDRPELSDHGLVMATFQIR